MSQGSHSRLATESIINKSSMFPFCFTIDNILLNIAKIETLDSLKKIKTLNVIQRNEGQKLYGELAKNGLIIVELKDTIIKAESIKVSVHTGKMMVDAFKSSTKKDGSILSVVSFAHSGAIGIFLDNNAGFYTGNRTNTGSNFSNVDALATAVKAGEVKFEKGATWVFGSCFTANGSDGRLASPSDALAEYTATQLNINTVGATGSVYPEVVGGKETGNLKTDGTFKKFEPYQVSKVVTTFKTFFGFKVPCTEKTKTVTETKVKVTDLGKKIDPKVQTK
jgi:hypothetical protein